MQHLFSQVELVELLDSPGEEGDRAPIVLLRLLRVSLEDSSLYAEAFKLVSQQEADGATAHHHNVVLSSNMRFCHFVIRMQDLGC